MNQFLSLFAILALACFAHAADEKSASSVNRGLAVVIDPDGLDTAVRLAKSGDFVVHWLIPADNSLRECRNKVRDAGVAGRVTVEHLGARLPYPDRFVDMLIVAGAAVPDAEIKRVLAVGGRAKAMGKGGSRELVRDPNDPIDDWSHAWYDATGNPVSKDEVAGVPVCVQWAAGPSFADGSIGGKMPRIAGGTFFAIDSVDGSLFARSAGNGLAAWRLDAKVQPTTDMAVVGDRLYAHADASGISGNAGSNRSEAGPLIALDTRTGKKVQTFEDGAKVDGQMVMGKAQPFPGFVATGKHIVQAVGKDLAVLDRASGKRVWTQTLDDNFVWFAPIVLGDQVIAVECAVPPRRNRLTNSNEAVAVTAFALADGKRKWRTTDILPPPVKTDKPENPGRPGLVPIIGADGLVLLHGGSYQSRAPNAFLAALSAKDGKELWRHVFNEKEWTNTVESSRLVYRDGVVYYLGGRGIRAFDGKTGEEKTEFLKRPKYAFNGFGECSGSRATTKYLIANGLCFWDKDLKLTETWAARSSCGTGLIPANGLLYALPTGCDCRSYSRGYLGLNCTALPPAIDDAKRLSAGEAKPANAKDELATDGWPMFLANPQRSSTTKNALPAKMEKVWSTKVVEGSVAGALTEDRKRDERYLGELSAPVADGSKVIVACPERAEVVALSLDKGEILWRFPVGGAVDSPPTLIGDLAIFGCHDGKVYAVTQKEGKLAWSFQAAPIEQKAMLHGQLSSAFPVHGSVQVLQGKLLVSAGFHSDLGGLHVWSLDPATGKVLGKGVIEGGRAGKPPAMNDVFSADAKGETAWIYTDSAVGPDAKPLDVPWKRLPRDGTGPVVAIDRAGAFVRFTHDKRGGSTHGWKGAMRSPAITAHRIAVDGDVTYALTDPTEGDRHPVRNDQVKVLRAMTGTFGNLQELWAASIKSLGVHESYSALIKAGDVLVLGGGKRDGSAGFVQIIDAGSGKLLAEYEVPARVTECGLAASHGRLIVSCEDGTVVCFGKP